MNARLPTTLILTLLGAASPAQAGAEAAARTLADCARIEAPDARLACYDALAGRAPSTAKPAVTATAPAAAAPAVAGGAAADFGKPRPPPPKPEKGAEESVHASVARVAVDAQGHVTLTLDNGQVWSVIETDVRIDSGEAITIRHGALGSFVLVTASRHTYHVRRLR
ncbi:MAG: hypothetical protein JSR73_13895 [Proteobacteria bacterium]|nr:hypothetical protein [Pseudomonadota bacterium]